MACIFVHQHKGFVCKRTEHANSGQTASIRVVTCGYTTIQKYLDKDTWVLFDRMQFCRVDWQKVSLVICIYAIKFVPIKLKFIGKRRIL